MIEKLSRTLGTANEHIVVGKPQGARRKCALPHLSSAIAAAIEQPVPKKPALQVLEAGPHARIFGANRA